MSVSRALAVTAFLPMVVALFGGAAYDKGLVSGWLVLAVLTFSFAVAILSALTLRCPECRQLACVIRWGTSPVNDKCSRCGLDLTSVPAWGRGPASESAASVEHGAPGWLTMRRALALAAVNVAFVLVVTRLGALEAQTRWAAVATIGLGNCAWLLAVWSAARNR